MLSDVFRVDGDIDRQKKYVRGARGAHEGGGHAQGGGCALHPREPLVAPLTYFFHLYISIYPKNIREQNRSRVPPPEASVATEANLDPFRHPAGGGNPSSVAIFIISVLSMTRRG